MILFLVMFSAPLGHFTILKSTVVDNDTGLVWQRTVEPMLFTQATAAARCTELKMRLPTRLELQTLVDETRVFGAAIDSAAFPSTPAERFWTSAPGFAVSFVRGEDETAAPESFLYLRCVR